MRHRLKFGIASGFWKMDWFDDLSNLLYKKQNLFLPFSITETFGKSIYFIFTGIALNRLLRTNISN